MKALAALWSRELVRFYRDRSRLVGALAPPVVFWFLIGSGLEGAFRLPGASEGMSYLQYFFPFPYRGPPLKKASPCCQTVKAARIPHIHPLAPELHNP